MGSIRHRRRRDGAYGSIDRRGAGGGRAAGQRAHLCRQPGGGRSRAPVQGDHPDRWLLCRRTVGRGCSGVHGDSVAAHACAGPVTFDDDRFNRVDVMSCICVAGHRSNRELTDRLELIHRFLRRAVRRTNIKASASDGKRRFCSLWSIAVWIRSKKLSGSPSLMGWSHLLGAALGMLDDAKILQ